VQFVGYEPFCTFELFCHKWRSSYETQQPQYNWLFFATKRPIYTPARCNISLSSSAYKTQSELTWRYFSVVVFIDTVFVRTNRNVLAPQYFNSVLSHLASCTNKADDIIWACGGYTQLCHTDLQPKKCGTLFYKVIVWGNVKLEASPVLNYEMHKPGKYIKLFLCAFWRYVRGERCSCNRS